MPVKSITMKKRHYPCYHISMVIIQRLRCTKNTEKAHKRKHYYERYSILVVRVIVSKENNHLSCWYEKAFSNNEQREN